MSRIACCCAVVFCAAVCAGETDVERIKMEAEKLRDQIKQMERATVDKVQQTVQATKERLKARMADMDEQILMLRKEGKEDERVAMEQARAALQKRMGDAGDPMGGMPGDDFQQRGIVEKKQPQNGGVSRLRVKLATGAELEAEGPWLQTMPDTTREILDQFADPAKDGAVSFRVPDQIDGEGILQLRTTLLKIAPRVNVEYADKIRLMTASSEDPVQLRRAASVFRTLQKTYSNNNMGNGFPQGFFDQNLRRFNNNGQDMAPRFRDKGEDMIKLPDGTVQPRRNQPEMENFKKPGEPRNPKQPQQKDPNNDQF